MLVDLVGLSSSNEGATPVDTPAPFDSASQHKGEESEGEGKESNKEENERMGEEDKLVSRDRGV